MRIKDILLHLRLPFSLFLLPVFLFALSQPAGVVNLQQTFIVFIVLHLFIYPASNCYNSFMDKDQGSIGALKTPPKVGNELLWVSIFLDLTGIALATLISWEVSILCCGYMIVSRAYSWHGLRLKKYPVISWIIVSLFQGGYTFMVVSLAIYQENIMSWYSGKTILAMIISSLLVGGIYPISQIFQHQEDVHRGDITLSYLLGKKGTLIFSFTIYLNLLIIAAVYFNNYYNQTHFYILLACLLIPFLYMIVWLIKLWNRDDQANYSNTMGLFYLSTPFLCFCFILLFLLNNNLLS